ncbi:molybdenum cofactor biosynthesis protein [Auriscalpium vulgare]|uniref:Molybdenum cofactor biosynthesis protein n=1 Tax=Auriscalpium vulgare TaxID=40419 RepID=A0ACB8SB20_9AGAM|nr:molybdenum cofactor biosynthesis protein [Auriscalpium vulgare]
MAKIRVGVLTVSDTASSNESADKSGPTIRDILEERGFEIVHHAIAADDKDAVTHFVQEWSSGETPVDWIITTGGTGFGVRDVTPEAVSLLIERPASGLVHLLLHTSIQHTPLAALSRPVAGTVKNSLVVTLPGSVKAVKENLEALLSGGVVEHAIELIRGGSGKATHAALAATPASRGDHPAHSSSSSHDHAHHDGHHHHHSHTAPRPRTLLSNDLSLPTTQRQRVSPYHMVSYADALKHIFTEVSPLPAEELLVTPTLKGYVLAENVHAPQNVPYSKTTNVDGYAVRSTEPPGVYKVVTPATHKLADPVPQGYIYRINTGAPLPAGTDAVIMVEDTRLVSSLKDEAGEDIEENEVEILVSVPLGDNVREPGSDVRQGDLALQQGDLLRSIGGEIGTLVFVGRKKVKVIRRPVVAILSTGNELTDLHKPTTQSDESWSGIWDTNRPSLQAALEGLGYEVLDLGIVSDSVPSHVEAIQTGLEKADLLLTTGGTSMGASDLLKPVIERHFNGSIHFGRVSIKPGKPTTFATLPVGNTRKPMFALPGNPASALVTFYVFVVPALRKLGGFQEHACQFPLTSVKLEEDIRLDSRTEFHRVIVHATGDGLVASSTGGQRSSRVASLAGANGLIVLPQKSQDGPDRLKAGDGARVLLIGELQTR